MDALREASIVLVAGALAGLAGAAVFALAHRHATSGLLPRTALARAGSYAVLAVILVLAANAGVAGIALLMGLLGGIGLLEWARLYDLPPHHRVASVVAHVAVITAVALVGTTAAAILIAGIVLLGAVWPVVRADTGRAIRDLGYAAVGFMFLTVMLAHGVALVFEFGSAGAAVVLALAVGCAGADVAAFMVGRTFGRHALAPHLSPTKTVEGAIGGLLGTVAVLALFAPGLVPVLGWPVFLALVPLVAAGSIWGDLFESAAKREASVKDAGAWLPGFGGILDRIDSLLIVVAMGYWLLHLAVPA
jgi:phosphatidate cytidylyltransferase